MRVMATAEAAAEAAAALFVEAVTAAVAARGCARVCLAGGTPPRALYERLGGAGGGGVRWDKLRVYFGDERAVPPDDAESNYRMAAEALLRHVPVSPACVYRIVAERGAEVAAADYEAVLRATLADGEGRLDVVLLGIGTDGHTASLFPGSAALGERARWCVATTLPETGEARITLTLPVLNAARRVVFVATGAGKAAAVAAARAEGDVGTCPARGVRPERGTVTWVVDEGAGAGVGRGG